MSRPFDADYTPPAPMLQVQLARRGEGPRLGPALAFVDTGADVTFMPRDWLDELEATEIDVVRVRGIFGESRSALLYKVDLIVEGQRLPNINVIALSSSSEIILGRNVLNRLVLLLDGPGQTTDVLSQRPKAGRLLRESAEALAGPV
ncbi:MAG: aspartyl protease family protein [Anaerolineales bacterium]|nr:aspartyl protease family protein [Anaerolineales bacterium]